eukprot:scaffold110752_cov72-Phaeocystis_antarctica.AAC.2
MAQRKRLGAPFCEEAASACFSRISTYTALEAKRSLSSACEPTQCERIAPWASSSSSEGNRKPNDAPRSSGPGAAERSGRCAARALRDLPPWRGGAAGRSVNASSGGRGLGAAECHGARSDCDGGGGGLSEVSAVRAALTACSRLIFLAGMAGSTSEWALNE